MTVMVMFSVSQFFEIIDGLGNLYADQMFRTTAEAEGEGLDPVEDVKAPK